MWSRSQLRLVLGQRRGGDGPAWRDGQADPLLEVEVGRMGTANGQANLALLLPVEQVRGRHVLADDLDPDVVDPRFAVTNQDQAERDRLGLLGHVEDDLDLSPVAGPANAAGIHVVEREDGVGAINAHPETGPVIGTLGLEEPGKSDATAAVRPSADGLDERAELVRSGIGHADESAGFAAMDDLAVDTRRVGAPVRRPARPALGQAEREPLRRLRVVRASGFEQRSWRHPQEHRPPAGPRSASSRSSFAWRVPWCVEPHEGRARRWIP